MDPPLTREQILLSRTRHPEKRVRNEEEAEYDYSECGIRKRDEYLQDRVDPKKDDLYFHFLTAEYDYDPVHKTLVRLYGCQKGTNASMQVNVRGVYPHFYIKKPLGWQEDQVVHLVDFLDLQLRKYVSDYASKNTELMKILDTSNRLLLRWKPIVAEDLVYYSGPKPFDFIDIDVVYPKLVKYARDMIQNPRGMTKTVYENGTRSEKVVVPKWCPEDLVASIQQLQVYEADVDFIIRFLVDTKFVPSSWYMIPHGTYDLLRHPSERNSRAEIEVQVKWTDMKMLTDEEHKKLAPDYTEMDFDIECETGASGRFPKPEQNPVIKIGAILSSHLNPSLTKEYIFSLKSCRAPSPSVTVFCFNTEIGMMKGFREFVIKVSPRIVAHHNGNGFDIPYLEDRAKALGLDKNWAAYGLSLTRKAYHSFIRSKGFKKCSASIPGVLNLDTLRKVQEDPKMDEHNLQV